MTTATEIANKYNADHTAFINSGLEVKSRQEYLDWVAAWKASYRALSEDIRTVKGKRKPFRYEYRAKGEGDKGVARRTQTGVNPNYEEGYSTDYALTHLRAAAYFMIVGRQNAKINAGIRRAADQNTAEAA